jgi:predicted dehydrogenase
MGIHCVDLLHFVLGSPTEAVVALAGTKTFSYEVEDSGTVLLRTRDGAYCTVEANFNIPDSAARCRFEVYGTAGSMLAEGTIGQVEGGKLELLLSDGGGAYDSGQSRPDVHPQEVSLDPGNLYTKQIESFGESVLDGKPVEVPLSEALDAQRVIEAAYESARSGSLIGVGGRLDIGGKKDSASVSRP